MKRAVDIVRAFRGARILVIGDAMLDSYYEGTATRLCSEGPVPVVRRTAQEQVPGGAANVAANLRAMGADVDFVALIGTDDPGQVLRRILNAAGINDDLLVEDASVQTLHKLRILADEQYVVRFDEGETRHAPSQVHARLLANVERAFARCDAVIISDYCYGAVSDDMLDRVTLLRNRRPVPLIVDSKNLPRFASARATVVTPNLREACLAVDPASGDVPVQGTHEIEKIGRSLLTQVDAEHVALTLAERGVMLVSRAGKAEHIPAHPISRANDVGAGDSFASAVALALAAHAPIDSGVRIGIDAAAIAVSRRRTSVVHHQELLQRVSLEETQPPVDVTHLAEILRDEQRHGRTVVFTNGVFDILHAGHVQFLRGAKRLGDVLVVGVNTDAGARRIKGPNRPINSERDRVALVAALDPVDHVLLFDEDDPSSLIRALQPDVHAKGGDYAGEHLPEADAVREVGGRIEIVPLSGTTSTSAVIDRILSLALESQVGGTR